MSDMTPETAKELTDDTPTDNTPTEDTEATADTFDDHGTGDAYTRVNPDDFPASVLDTTPTPSGQVNQG